MNIRKNRLFGLAAFTLLTALILTLHAGFIHAAQEETGPLTASIAKINISFKVDPSITRGMYMGDRWISPPTYYVQEGKEVTVEVIAQGLDAQGKQVNINPAWKADDPAMIKISQDKGSKVVKLTIRKEGESYLKVSFGGISKKMSVKAWHKNEAIHVEISQTQKKEK